MKDTLPFKGHFKIESFDKCNKLIDVYEDDNMIMTAASLSMSEIFAGMSFSTGISAIRLGTSGHVGIDTTTPKTAVDGFVNTRDRMFSESSNTSAVPIAINAVIPLLNLNDVIYTDYIGQPGYYRYIGATSTNYTLTTADILSTAPVIWEFIHSTVPPYVYDISFNLPGTVLDNVNGDPVLNLVETDAGSGTIVNVLQSGSAVTFNIELAGPAGNKQNNTFSTFTEAALYANNRIFSLKTFRGKLKDSTVLIRITWTIQF